jgi:hypothetical protein
MRIRVLVLAATAALIVAATASAKHALTQPQRLAGPTNSTSSNWSGFDVTGGPFTSVSASWTQPQVTCAAGETSFSSFWVGLDGDTSSTVEQIGTDSDCINGAPTYYAWYELYPKGSGQLMTLTAGDAIDASVTTDGSGNFTLTITVNHGTPTTVTGKVKRASLASAEVIAEAPASNHGPNGELGLANFGTVFFTKATVDGSPLGTLSPDPITMAQNGTTLAVPSTISGGGGSFQVDWNAASGPPSHGNGNGHGHG